MSPFMKKTLGADARDMPGIPILARSLYRELKSNGCHPEQVLAICTEMIDQVTCELDAVDVANTDGKAASAA
jgi:hypothetical protein